MVTVFSDLEPDDFGWRFDHWRESHSRAGIRWVDQDGEHDDPAVIEQAALDPLVAIRDEPEARLVSCDVEDD